MPFLLRSALKDLKRQLSDPAATFLWMAIPLAIAIMIFLAFGGRESKTPTAILLVADEDSTFVSGALIQALGNASVINVETVTRDAGRQRIESGKGSAFLVLPKGFNDSILNRTPMTLTLVTNPAQRILPGIIEESLSMLVDGVFYLQETAGEELDTFLAAQAPGGGFDAATIAAFSVTINDIVQKASGTLFPPVLDFKVETPPAKEEGPGFGVLFFPGILFMSLLFMGQGLSADLWTERNRGTLRRALATPGGGTAFLGGKILSGMVMAGVVTTLAMVIGGWLFGLALDRLFVGFFWSILCGGVFLSLMMIVQVHSGTENSGNLMISFLLFPLLMVGGSFFPFEAMPPFLARIGSFTPNGWALIELKNVLLGRSGPADLLIPAAVLTAVGGAAFLVSALRLRRFTMGA